jgi:hypothetical protein
MIDLKKFAPASDQRSRTFLSRNLPTKLECLTLLVTYPLDWLLKARLEPTWVEPLKLWPKTLD